MKTSLIITSLLSILLLTSCVTTKDPMEPDYSFYGFAEDSLLIPDVDAKQGKWLLHEIDVPNRFHDGIYSTIQGSLKDIFGDRLYETAKTQGVILPQPIPLRPDEKQIHELYQGTNKNYDYLINIQGFILAEDRTLPGIAGYRGSNAAQLVIEIYDLKKGTLFYSHYVTTFDKPEGTNNTVINGRSGELLEESYKVILSKLKANIIK